MTTSIKRSYKNAQEQQSLLDNTQKSFFRKISLSNVELMETQLLYTNSGSRTDYVEIETQGNSGAYKNIAITIENIKQKLNVTDKQIAQWIRKTFKGETEIYASLDRIKLGQKEELGEFITALTYLLFGTEAVRNPASLIIHQIMLDLIIQNKLTFLSAFTHLENNGVAKYDESNLTVEIISSNKFYKHISGGLMPMSQKRIEQPDIGAVDVARLMHKMFETSMKYTYDKANIDASFAKDMQAYKLFKKIINFEANIIKKWVRTGASEQEILEKLMMKCEEWYGAAPMMQIIIHEIPYNPFYSDIDDLTTKKLIIFKNVFEEDNQAQNKLQRLKNSGANLDLILTIYQDNIEKYNDLSSEEITKIMNKEDLLFSDISDIFDLGMTYELLSELYHEYEEEDKERNKFHDILNVASLEVRKHGYKKINELYDEAISELGGPFDEYGDWSSDILDIVESKLSGDNGQSDSEST